ncbi:hypothetical protein E2C01_055961 [Portunus trituberculatus]|uniref:Uncharacterized protein n=1 Tax=Portunus trituberculatus TaxID=210409 RepID=A0A5B7GZ18_PORTR|nr:hypothetical protein [Portunus trituberculatus]
MNRNEKRRVKRRRIKEEINGKRRGMGGYQNDFENRGRTRERETARRRRAKETREDDTRAAESGGGRTWGKGHVGLRLRVDQREKGVMGQPGERAFESVRWADDRNPLGEAPRREHTWVESLES